MLAPVGRSGSIIRMMSNEDETRAVTEVAQRLTVSFPDVGPDVIQDTVHASHQRFAGSPIRAHVAIPGSLLLVVHQLRGAWNRTAPGA